MLVFHQKTLLKRHLSSLRAESRTISFVPTMGALHDGHLSLLQQANAKADISVVSIFVNPTQFGDSKDLEKYPRPIGADIEKLESGGCDILYMPEVADIYDEGINNLDEFDLNGLDTKLEGASRPGHFQGVVQIVSRLLDAVPADFLMMGQKDYQQVQVIQTFLNASQHKVKLVTCPIIRESNGLAMSSRNERLTEHARSSAGCIYATLVKASEQLKEVQPAQILESAINELNNREGYQVDYFGFYDAATLEPVNSNLEERQLVILTAVYVEDVRLLDNMLIPNVE